MLVLNRRVGERIVIDESIVVAVVKVAGNNVRLAISAPTDIKIRRSELPAVRVTDRADLAQIVRRRLKATSA